MKFIKLGDIVTIKKGKKPLFSELPNEKSVRVLQIDDLRNDNNLKFTDDKTGVLVNEEDVLLAWDGANAGTIGYGKTGYIGSTIAVLKKKNSKDYSTVFIGKFLQSQFEYLRSKATGATIPHIDRKSLDSLKLPIIDFTEQIRIAEILTQAENLITQRKESILLLDELLKSTFLEMFGDPVRNEKGWEIKTIEQLVKKEKHSIKRGPFGGALKKDIFVSEGYLVYEQYHALNNDFTFERYYINDEKFNELKAFEVFPNDIIISCSGVYLGKLAIIPQNAKRGIINQALLKIVLDQKIMSNHFFVFLFTHNSFKNKFFGEVRGSGVPNFPPIVEFKKFDFIYPPLDLQNKFVTIVKKVEALKIEYQASLTELENMYGVLSQKAFKGELKVKEYTNNEVLGMVAETEAEY